MKILITGITGFVGSHLAELCLTKDMELFGFKRYHLSKMDNVKHIEDKIIWHDCDMTDYKSVKIAIKDIMPDIIFHMASQSFVSPSWNHPTLYMRVNYEMTVNLMEACMECGINPKIHLPGSGEEYGEIYEEEIPITPKTTLRPVNPYAVSKVAQDLIGYVYFRSYGLNIIRTRAFNHEGRRRDKVFGIPSFAYQIARIEKGLQKPIIRVGDVDDKRNFTHVKDIVEAYCLAVEKCEPGELYLIGNEDIESVHTFEDALFGLLELSTEKVRYSVEVHQCKEFTRLTKVPRLICDTSKFRKLTNWKPKISFQEILQDTLNYWRERV